MYTCQNEPTNQKKPNAPELTDLEKDKNQQTEGRFSKEDVFLAASDSRSDMLPVRLRLNPKTRNTTPLLISSERTTHLKMTFTPRTDIAGNQWLIVVPKSIVKLAVDRNRTKRVLREATRKLYKKFPSGEYKIRLLKNIDTPLVPHIEEELFALLSKIKTSQEHDQ